MRRIPARGDAAVRALCHVLIASWISSRPTDHRIDRINARKPPPEIERGR
jgi:hypothetical protein